MAANAVTSGLSPFVIREIVDALTSNSFASCRHDNPFSARAASSAACNDFTSTVVPAGSVDSCAESRALLEVSVTRATVTLLDFSSSTVHVSHLEWSSKHLGD